MDNLNYYFKKYRKQVIIVGVCLILLIIVISIIWKPTAKKEETNYDELSHVEEKENVDKANSDFIKVDIKGAVKSPGVYELKVGDRVEELIQKSGGLSSEADTSMINLSKELGDQMVVLIYTKQEIAEMRKGSTSVKFIDQECTCPKIDNNACIDEKITNNSDKTTNSPNTPTVKGKVSLNKGSLKELEALTGIGASKAQAIINYRNSNGGFKTIEELKKVKGIGDLTFEKLKNDITL